ncbi:Carbonic anhydrase [Nostocoides japonicum T1-X7]|uniref:carbonic anhydrase n=1 Tax=Nostocoides japonicum T1-X7 TaxID=1194083 RepID=A0A077M765_9MICO|nr:carbonic anhydrase [Tetrasphaera japonica]CCH79895.1 Carbonic anhydrase [Tetrasphaera japonica T1-X7]
MNNEIIGFDDLLEANRDFARTFSLGGFDGVAHRGIAVVTCMDSRIDPLGMLGLKPGDAKIFRNPGGRVDEVAMEALILGVHLLEVDRILVIPHTRCAVASSTEEELHAQLDARTGVDTSWQHLHVITDQRRTVRYDVHKVRAHPLVPESVLVGGFLYDVDTGLLEQIC